MPFANGDTAKSPNTSGEFVSAVQLRHVRASCNRRPGSFALCSESSLAAFTAHNVVHLLQIPPKTTSEPYPICESLRLHSAVINAITLLRHNSTPNLLSVSADGTLAHAILQDKTWKVRSIPAHSCSLAAVDAIVTPDNRLFVATVSTQSHLSLWHFDSELTRLSQLTLPPAPNGRQVLPECVAIHALTDGTIIIAVGGTHPAIQLFAYSVATGLHFLAHLCGHRDWIRSLTFHSTPHHLLLASASTDTTARTWTFSLDHSAPHTATLNVALPNARLSVFKRALLDEHSAAVHTVSFASSDYLVTASLDCSICVWRIDDVTICVARFGLMGGQTAHALGFYGAAFTSPFADCILAHNFSGAIHRWNLDDENGLSAATPRYISYPGITGHFAEVTDLAWSPCGRFLMTSSLDKTTRIFTEFEGKLEEWARPQVHGHAIFTLAFTDPNGRSFVSGSEEKMLRVFEAPSSFQLPGGNAETGDENQATAAVMPQLGLSNKALFADNGASGNGNGEVADSFSTFGAERAKSTIPLEEDLCQYRLWPETAKLYGHGNEISCVAFDLEQRVLASACRAQVTKDAVIILWDIDEEVECGRLETHDLTVNQLQFTVDGNSLLSVSKDRSFAVHERQQSRFGFKLVYQQKAAHTRMPNCGTWIEDHRLVATGGRDKCIKVFALPNADASEGKELQKIKLDSAVSDMDFTRTACGKAIVAAGHESGVMRLFKVSFDTAGAFASLQPLWKSEDYLRCGARISTLQWRPRRDRERVSSTELELGVASEDRSVRVYSVNVP